MRVGTDGEQRARACGPHQELAVGHAVALVDLDRDAPLNAEIDEALLPFLGIDALGIAERLKRGERGVAEDVEVLAVNPFRDDLERALEYSFLQRGIGETLPLFPALEPALHERSGVVIGDPLSVNADLMDGADEVVKGLACARAEWRRDSEVVLEANAKAEP